MITQRTRLDMRPGGVMPVVHVSQYDNDAAALIFDLYEDGTAFEIPAGYSVLINGLKPDNYGFSYAAASYSGNTVICNLTTQMTAVAGAVVCELRVRNGAGTQVVGSANFVLQVEEAALTDDTIISDTMIPLIEQAVEIASNLDRYITQTQENAEEAQRAATTATTAAQSAQTVDANVTALYNSIETAKQNANAAAANANTVAANIAAAAERGDYKGDKGDKGDSGITAPVWGMYTMYVDESTGDLWLVTNGEYGSEYWFRYDSETGNLYYCTPEYVEKTVSGELIEITDAANLGALQCKVAFSPIQSGTGDPSPSNIRPISGRTGLTVTRAGKNIAKPIETTATLAGVSWAVTADGKVTASGTATGNTQVNLNYANNVLQLPKGVPLIISGSTEQLAVRVCYRTTDAPSTTVTLASSYDGADATGTIPDNAKDAWVRVLDMAGTGVAVNAECYPMVRISGNADYEPYTAQEYPISWQTEAGTVYGGTLDVVSGVLTVDTILATITAFANVNANWSNSSTIVVSGSQILTEPRDGTKRAKAVSNMLPNAMGYGIETAVGGASVTTPCFGLNANEANNRYIYARFPISVGSTLEEVNAYLSENPFVIAYAIQNKQTYQLTPQEIRTLLGVNNLWSDGDTIEAFTYVSESYDEEG